MSLLFPYLDMKAAGALSSAGLADALAGVEFSQYLSTFGTSEVLPRG